VIEVAALCNGVESRQTNSLLFPEEFGLGVDAVGASTVIEGARFQRVAATAAAA